MAYDFTNPQDQQAFAQAAAAKGASIEDTNAYIAKRRSEQATSLKDRSSIYSSKASILKSQSEIDELAGTGKPDSEKLQMVSLVDEVLGRDTKPVTGLMRIRSGIPGTEAKYTSKLAEQIKSRLSVSAREKMKGSGAISDFEAQLLSDSVSALDKTLSDEAFRAELNKIKSVLSGGQAPQNFVSGGQQTPQDFTSTQRMDDYIEPAVNVSGGLAGIGDLIRDPETGKMMIHGDQEKDPLFKKGKVIGGFRVDNALIRFLAESKAAPTVGGIAGFIGGGPLGSAAGAGGGETFRQGLRELLNPDEQDLSMMAQAVMNEMLIDAAFSTFTFGIGKIGKLGKQSLLLTKPGSAASKAAGRAVAGEVAETTGKRFLGEAGGELLEKAGKTEYKGLSGELYGQAKTELKRSLNLTPTEQKNFLKAWKIDPYDALLQDKNLPKSFSELELLGRQVKFDASSELGEILSRQNADIDDVLRVLEKAKKEFKLNGEVFPGMKKGISFIDENVEFLNKQKKFGNTIGGEDLNRIKQGIQKAAFEGTETASSKVVQEAAPEIRKFIEELPKDMQEKAALKGNNFLKSYGKMSEMAGMNAAIKDKGIPLFGFVDSILLLNPKALITNKMVQWFSSKALGDMGRVRLLKAAADILTEKVAVEGASEVVKQQARETMRNLLRLGMKSGMTFGLDNSIVQPALKSARFASDQFIQEPTNDSEAFSPEGTPLYR